MIRLEPENIPANICLGNLSYLSKCCVTEGMLRLSRGWHSHSFFFHT